jgi:two-component system sensor histidine kinase ChvG
MTAGPLKKYPRITRVLRAAASIRTKFALLSFVVVFVPIFLLNRYALREFDRFTSRALEEEMISHARFLGEQFRLHSHTPATPARTQRFRTMLRELGPQLQSRLRILSPAGIVLYDSSPKSMVGQDIASYPEVAKARSGHYGSRWRMTSDSSYVYYYIAMPVEAEGEGETLAITHVLRHTGPIIKAIKRMAHQQDATLGVSLLAAMLLSLIVAQTVTRRLRKLTSRTRKFSRTGRFAGDIGGHDEITELGQAMSRMTDDLDRRSAYNREFVATLMHELKAPLTAIRGAADVLEDGATENPKAREKFFGNIRFEVDRVTRLVGELADLTKLDNELASEMPEPIDYLAALRDIEQRLPIMLDTPHAPIHFNLPEPDTAISIRISAARLEQIIINLLDNAIRHTPATGSVTVEVAPHTANEITTHVRDTGCGITAANLPKIFDRFFTTEPKGRRQDAGSGLGLAVVKSIVERHHGSITVASTPTEGATFTIVLPPAG